MKKYDIIVAGGGFAGAAAAISAGRLGKKVLLFDKSNCMGGAAANALVNPFMPYSTRIDGKQHRLSSGLFLEIQDELDKLRLLTGETMHMAGRSVFGEEHLKLLLNRMAKDAGVDLLYHAYLCGVNCSDGKVNSVTVATKSGNIELFADYFIDATGDADLTYRAGIPCRLGRESDGLCQPMTLCFRVSNVDTEKFAQERPKMQELYKQYKAEGKIHNPREDVLVFDKFMQKGVIHFNTTRIVRLNPVDPFDVTAAEIEAREQAYEVYLLLKNNLESMKDSELISTASEIGVRESRMINGLHILTGKEIVDCTKFEDSIACGNYDIDIHNPEGEGTSHYFFPDGQYYEIPYRTLVPRDAKNLFAAGRCISVDHEAQASVRIMPIVCCLGEAAGVAAAVCADEGTSTHDANVKRIQEILVNNGAVIH
ncbi:MAG: FAD-dependent oxidoreductase [Clostridia bacterium]|nr:FAD-dependent oxidoreductase [Clostridia bacterium]